MYNPTHYDAHTFQLFIDACGEGGPSGRFCNPCLAESGSFQCMTQLIIKINECLDIHGAPQSFQAIRRFPVSHPAWTDRPCSTSTRPGNLANFTLQILFRRNASWQGTVTWLEAHQTQRFRSALELMTLINSALQEHREPDAPLSFGGRVSPLNEAIEG